MREDDRSKTVQEESALLWLYTTSVILWNTVRLKRLISSAAMVWSTRYCLAVHFSHSIHIAAMMLCNSFMVSALNPLLVFIAKRCSDRIDDHALWMIERLLAEYLAW